MNRRRGVILVVILLAAGLLAIRLSRGEPVIKASSSLTSLPVEVKGAYQAALPGLALEFPQDHGAHDDYQTEWWYFTGNLQDSQGQEFGYQLTFFRRAIQPAAQQMERGSAWATNQIYLAHFTLTNVTENDFHYWERFSRGAAGLAGAKVDPWIEIWLEDWQVQQLENDRFQLQAKDGEFGLDLRLEDQKTIAFQGDEGYSQKGEQPGNASIYYSIPHLVSSGELTWQGQIFEVTGLSWMDHEFSTSALSGTQVGWDWFGLHLSDGSELMVYHIRNADGEIDPFSKGLYIRPDGTTKLLKMADFSIEAGASWTSPHSGAVYPAEWVVRVPGEDLEISIKPLIRDQELNVSFVYWEGAVSIEGVKGKIVIEGRGYVELTGYAQSMQGRF